jgi:hypothetical protein
VIKPEEKRPIGRPRYRWMDDNKINLREIGRGGMDWIDLAQDRGYCEHGKEPSGFHKIWGNY